MKKKIELKIKTDEGIEINDTIAFGIWICPKKFTYFQVKIKHIVP